LCHRSCGVAPLALDLCTGYRRPVAGYSGTPLPQKLGIKPGSRLGLFDAPDGFGATLGPLPERVTKTTRLGGALDVALFFTTSRAALEKRFAAFARAIAPSGSLWIAWPKKTSGKKTTLRSPRRGTDLDENVIRAVGLEKRLVDVKVCAIDETWSGLKFVVRVKDRR
jgi:hypothetical protein